jgi:hypothetical protein
MITNHEGEQKRCTLQDAPLLQFRRRQRSTHRAHLFLASETTFARL